MIVAYLTNPSKEDKEFCEQLVEKSLEEKVKIVDLSSWPIDHLEDDLIICFGKQATIAVNKSNSLYLKKIDLPTLDKLKKLPNNRASRQKTWKALMEFRNETRSPRDASAKTKNGKKVVISDTKRGDITISLKEIQLIKLATEKLGLEDFKFEK